MHMYYLLSRMRSPRIDFLVQHNKLMCYYGCAQYLIERKACLKVTKSMYISQITRIIIHKQVVTLHVIFFIRIVVTSLPIYECNYHMAGKNIKKYHLQLWSSHVKILDLSLVALRLLMINPIFSLVMTITTRNIFKYFPPPYHPYVGETEISVASSKLYPLQRKSLILSKVGNFSSFLFDEI